MNATRTRLITLGLVRPNVVGNRKASQAHAIAARKQELRKTVVVQKGLSTIPRAA